MSRSRGARAALAAAPLALVLAACGGARAAERVVVTGSSTIAPLMGEIARRFEAQHPGVRVEVQSGGSSRGLADVRAGRADLGMVSRDPGPGEDDLVWMPIARDGVALIANAAIPLESLSREEVLGIYTGAISNWKALGGPDAPITVVHKAEGRATLDVFLGYLGIPGERVRPTIVIGENAQGIKTVAGDPHALGYVSIGAAEVAAREGERIRLLALDGVRATDLNVAAGTYPMRRTLHLVARGEPAGAALEFARFAASPAVRDLVRREGFVSIPPR